MRHLHGVLRGGAIGGRVVKAWPRPSRQALLSVGVVGMVVSMVMVPVVMVTVVMVVGGAVAAGQGVKSLGLVGRHVEGGLLDRVSLHCHLLGPVATGPARRGRERLPRLWAEILAVHGLYRRTEVTSAVPVLMSGVGARPPTGTGARRAS